MDNGTHVIDHFLVNNGLFDHMLDYYSRHNGVNLSFHSPMVLTLNVDVNYFPSSSRVYRSRPKWQEASDFNLSQYSTALGKLIDELSMPWHSLKCCNKHFTSRVTHCKDIQICSDSIINCIRVSWDTILYKSKQCKSNIVAGWNEHITLYTCTEKHQFYGIISGKTVVLLAMLLYCRCHV